MKQQMELFERSKSENFTQFLNNSIGNQNNNSSSISHHQNKNNNNNISNELSKKEDNNNSQPKFGKRNNEEFDFDS